MSLQKRLPDFAAYITKHSGGNITSVSDISNLHHLLVQEVAIIIIEREFLNGTKLFLGRMW